MPADQSTKQKQKSQQEVLSSPLGEKVAEGRMRGKSGLLEAWKRLPVATKRAKSLRRTETEAEFRLWSELRNRLLNGYKFSRQIPLGPYFADFLCREGRLVVELDGSQHSGSTHDVLRTSWLNANRYSVLRFWNHEVTGERQSVLETIVAVLEGHITARCETLRYYPSSSSPKARKAINTNRGR